MEEMTCKEGDGGMTEMAEIQGHTPDEIIACTEHISKHEMACGNADQSHTASQKSKGQPEALLRLYLDYNPSKALKSREEV